MANISALLEIIRTAHLGRDMRQALHDSIESVNNDTETALGKSLTFTTATRKLSLKAKDGTVLSEAVIPGGGSGGGSVDSVNEIFPDENGNVEVNLNDINDVDITSATDGQLFGYDGVSGKWKNVNAPSGGGGSNDNLLANAWFNVNTKGFTSISNFSGTYLNILDGGWSCESESGFDKTIALNNDNNIVFTIEHSSSRNTYAQIWQNVSNYSELVGKTVTLSCNVNGQIVSKTFTVVNNEQNVETFVLSEDTSILIGYDFRTSTYRGTGAFWFYPLVKKEGSETSYTFTITSVKLELGSTSTLAHDIEPNWEVENIKCGNGANKQDITSIVATGTTNNTGNTITNGQLFYLNGTLCKALSNIASGSAFTLNTNYEVHNINSGIKAKYIDYFYQNATTSGTQYTISNAKSTVFGLSSGNTIYGLAPRRSTGDTVSSAILQMAYDPSYDELKFISMANNSNYISLQFTVLYV